jgi:hypothetical protein
VPADRARPGRGRAQAGLDLVEAERLGDDPARARLHRPGQDLGGAFPHDQHHADVGIPGDHLADQVEHWHRAELVVDQDDVELAPADRGHQVRCGRGGLEDPELARLLEQCPQLDADLVAADAEQDLIGHRPPPPFGAGAVGVTPRDGDCTTVAPPV